MKLSLWTVAAALGALVAAPASAQFYIGGAVGKSDLNPETQDWVAGAPFTTTFDDTDVGWKIFGGYQITQNFGLEVAWTDLGKYTAVNTVPGVDTGTANVKVRSIAGFVTGRAPITQNFAFMGKIGASWNESKMSFASGGVLFVPAGSDTYDKASFAWGLGAIYSFSKTVAMRVEYEDFGEAGRSNFLPGLNTSRSQPHFWSVGAQFSF